MFLFLAELRQTCNYLVSIPCNHYIYSLFSCLAERASDFRLSWIPSKRQSSKSLIAVNVCVCFCVLVDVLSDSFVTILLRSGNYFVLLCSACGDIDGELNVASSSMWQRLWWGVKNDPHCWWLRKSFILKNFLA